MGLVIQNERICYTAPHEIENPLPYVVYVDAINQSAIRTITYTATADGVYQLYVFWNRNSGDPTLSDISVTKNNVALTLTLASDYSIAYDEVTLSTGDVITVSNTSAVSNRGVILFVTQNAKISNYELVGSASNNNTTFPIGHDSAVLECYQYSFYNNAIRYNYHIVADQTNSIATPNTSTYYYGGTWAIRV